MIQILLPLALLAAPAAAQAESPERRADRLRTIELNERARAVVRKRDNANADVRNANREAMERYEQQRAEWRRRVEACRGGDWNACER